MAKVQKIRNIIFYYYGLCIDLQVNTPILYPCRYSQCFHKLVFRLNQLTCETPSMLNSSASFGLMVRSMCADIAASVPLVADIHFNPKAAFEAAATTDKVRINPGNFVDAEKVKREEQA